MDTFATASLLLAVIAVDAIVSQLFTASHGDRMATSPPSPAVAALAMAPHREANPPKENGGAGSAGRAFAGSGGSGTVCVPSAMSLVVRLPAHSRSAR